MTEHRIRLRGGWECSPIEAPESETSRLTLPTRWESGASRRLRLIRRFQQPALEPGSEMILHMDQVPGIRRLQIDGRCTPQISADQSQYEIALDRSKTRRKLVLEIETPASDPSMTEPQDWGFISLIIRSFSAGVPPRAE